MPINPLTGKSQLTPQQQIHAERAVKSTAASKSLGKAGKLPVNARVKGKWKVGAYVVANVLTLGIVGQIGAYSARSSVMGSIHPNDEKNPWKDMGQTHLNATQDLGKALNTFNKFVTHVVGFIPGHIAGIGFVLDAKMADPGFAHVESYKQNADNKLVNVNKVKHLGVGDLGNIRNAGKPIWAKVDKELNGAEKDPAGQGSLVKAALITGSDELKAAWNNHLEKEFSLENGLFAQWTFPINDKMNQESEDFDANHQLSKYELAVAYHDFAEQAGKHGINVSSSARDKFKQGIIDAVGWDYVQEVKSKRDDLERAENELKAAHKKNPRSPETIQKIQNLTQKKQLVSDMRQANDVKLPPQASQQAFLAMKPAHEQIAKLMNDTMTRFKIVAYENNLLSQGYNPETINKSNQQINDDLRILEREFVNLGYEPAIAKSRAQEVYRPFNQLSDKQKFVPREMEKTRNIVQSTQRRVLDVAGNWRQELNARFVQVKKDLIDKGVPEKKADDVAKMIFGNHLDYVPGSHEKAKERLKQVEIDCAENFAALTSELDQAPPGMLDRTGQKVDLAFDENAKDYVAKDINADIKRGLNDQNDAKKTMFDNTDNEGVYGAFVRDFGRAKFTVNGVVISDPGDKSRSPKKQMDECKQKLLEAGVLGRDIPMLTQVLHQGIGGTLQTMPRDPLAEDVAPTNLHFSHDGSKEHQQAGDGVSISIVRNDDGKYQFGFELKNPMSSVSDGTDVLAKPFITDPSKSRSAMSLSGVFDPQAQNDDWVTVNDASYSYNAVPQAAKYRDRLVEPPIVQELDQPNQAVALPQNALQSMKRVLDETYTSVSQNLDQMMGMYRSGMRSIIDDKAAAIIVGGDKTMKKAGELLQRTTGDQAALAAELTACANDLEEVHEEARANDNWMQIADKLGYGQMADQLRALAGSLAPQQNAPALNVEPNAGAVAPVSITILEMSPFQQRQLELDHLGRNPFGVDTWKLSHAIKQISNTGIVDVQNLLQLTAELRQDAAKMSLENPKSQEVMENLDLLAQRLESDLRAL